MLLANPDLDAEILQASEVETAIERLFTELPGVADAASRRLAAGYALLRLAQNHHAGLVALARSGLWASAFAMVRVVVDASIRSIWVLSVAEGNRVRDIAESATFNFPQPTQMLRAIGDKYGSDKRIGPLLEVVSSPNEYWSTLCDFTHVGHLMVRRYALGRTDTAGLLCDSASVIRYGTAYALVSSLMFALLADWSGLVPPLQMLRERYVLGEAESHEQRLENMRLLAPDISESEWWEDWEFLDDADTFDDG